MNDELGIKNYGDLDRDLSGISYGDHFWALMEDNTLAIIVSTKEGYFVAGGNGAEIHWEYFKPIQKLEKPEEYEHLELWAHYE